MTTGVVLLFLLGAAVWFWIDSLAAREAAVAAGTRACSQINVQFLDQSVAAGRVRPARDPRGYLVFRRVFVFEFSNDGGDRRSGRVTVLGRRVESITLDQDQHTTWLTTPEE